ncbi:MAG: AAA family ATPase, partial [Lacipirellulaceae bacterium]
TEYSFGERSSGLKYFLSYYIQYLGYQPEGRTPEILLMDEPDAYLSSQGQQDLLKLFDAFAHPEGSRPPVQVVYVTHSPFLIDKNHAERIRVLEKGVSDEGTRVVRDVSKNHYEPLRSAFGAFVGETTFIGNCNLVVEGPADQMLLAGAAALLRAEGTGERETLDLNHITIVPAGSASHVPYIVYLARGRDIVKPAVIVLLDSDKEGNKAVKDLRRGGARQQVILDSKLILQVGDLEEIDLADNQHLLETEDLVPLSICVEAVSVYFAEVYGVDENAVQEITADSISKHLNENTSVFKAIEAELAGLEEPLHIEKMGFARAVLSVVNRRIVSANDQDKDPDALAFLQNMRVLFAALTLRQRQAERDTKVDRVSQKIERLKSAFANDHSTSASREQVLLLFEEVDAVLDSSDESNAIRLIVHQIKQEYQIEEDVTEPVARYDDFLQRLDHLRYAG